MMALPPPSENFRVAIDGAVAVITLDVPNEPVNTLSPQVGEEFATILTALENEIQRDLKEFGEMFQPGR